MSEAKQIEQVRMAQGLPPGKATDAEVQFLIDTAARLGLDPIARQVWYQARADKQGVRKHQVLCTIDGLRVVAERTGQYEGQTAPQWCGKDGTWRDVWTGPFSELVAARVGVYRKGFREPMYATARLDAYVQGYDGKPSGQWGKMADHMTAKCAEALALRKAFPQQLSGIYTADEMREHDRHEHVERDEPAESAPTGRVSPARLSAVLTPDELRVWCTENRVMVSDAGQRGRAKVEAHGSSLGVPIDTVRAWLGAEDDGTLDEDPPVDPQADAGGAS